MRDESVLQSCDGEQSSSTLKQAQTLSRDVLVSRARAPCWLILRRLRSRGTWPSLGLSQLADKVWSPRGDIDSRKLCKHRGDLLECWALRWEGDGANPRIALLQAPLGRLSSKQDISTVHRHASEDDLPQVCLHRMRNRKPRLGHSNAQPHTTYSALVKLWLP